MSDVSVSVENILSTVVVESMGPGTIVVQPGEDSGDVVVEPVASTVVQISSTGIQGPPGPAAELADNYIIDGGNF